MLPEPGYYWPPGALRVNDNDNIDALKRAFAQIGFEECATGDWEPGYRKVALYVTANDDWSHAAIQVQDGQWQSKLGNSFDIQHKTPQCLEGPAYGTVACFMRSRTAPVPNPNVE